jgi:hypothetical protein
MRGRHRKHEVDLADRLGDIAAAGRAIAGRTHQQVGAAVEQGFPGAGQGFLHDAQAGLLATS